jgi:hypothetical protein
MSQLILDGIAFGPQIAGRVDKIYKDNDIFMLSVCQLAQI